MTSSPSGSSPAPVTGAGLSGGVRAEASQRDTVRLGIVRYLAWVLIVLIVCFAVLLAIFCGNRARDTLLTKQKSFAGILAEHLNQQIFVRFSIPVVANYGRQNLKQNAQYMLLDQTVASLTHGLQVYGLRIFDDLGEIKYSSRSRDEVGYQSPETKAMTRTAMETNAPIFIVDRNISFWQSFLFLIPLRPGAVYLRTIHAMRPVYSLRVENTANYSLETGPTLGILEFTQDITKDMADIVRLQWTIIGVTLASALLLLFLLLSFLHRAEAALTLRMEERQHLIDELHQHEKLAGMGRVVAGIAHEIRNPLGIIQSSAEFLLSRTPDKDAVTSKILRAIFDESHRLAQTVSDFLDYARPRQPQRNLVSIASVIKNTLAFLEPEIAARKVAVRISLGTDDGGQETIYTLGDKDLLHRAFYNILVNSIQAMGSGGSIAIAGRAARENGMNWLVVTFADSGPGFPREDRKRLLDPFVTTKDGGTGLGLPIVNSIITSHGGSMSLEDDPESGGALVRVLLPAASVS